MRILMLSGGQPSPADAELSSVLRHEGHEVVSLGVALDLRDREWPGADVAHDVGAGVRRSCGSWEPQVIHAMDALGGVTAHVAAWRGVPVVQSISRLAANDRRFSQDSYRDFSRAVILERHLLGWAARVVAGCTEQVLELFRMGLSPERVRVIPMAIEPRKYFTEPARGPLPRRVTLLHVGSLADESGIRDVVAALTMLPAAQLVAVGGSAKEWGPVRAYARRLHVAHRVRHVGQLPPDRMVAAYGAADVVVRAPWRSWSDRIVLEAVSARRPVVASATGSLLDLVEDGETGLVVPPRSPEVIAGAVVRLADMDEQARLRMVARAYEVLNHKHSWRHRLPVLMETYESAVSWAQARDGAVGAGVTS